MNIFSKIFKAPDWLPTKEDIAKWRKEDRDRYNQEIPQLISQSQDEQAKLAELEKLLLSKLDYTEQDIYLAMKSKAQTIAFIQGRIDYRLKQ